MPKTELTHENGYCKLPTPKTIPFPPTVMEKQCRRRKIEFIQDSRARDVTFVKRRGGLFRKAAELAILCGAQCGIITFSKRGTPFVFGHPSADAVINRFIGGYTDSDHAVPAAAISVMEDQILSEAVGRLESSKKKRKLNNNNVECSRRRFWWDEEKLIDDMKVEELELYGRQIRELRKKVRRRMEEMMMVVNDDATLNRIPIPGEEDQKDESPKIISSNSLMVSSSSSSCHGSSKSSSDDDYYNIFESLDDLVPPRSVISVSNSNGGDDFWQMMTERGQEQEDEMIIPRL